MLSLCLLCLEPPLIYLLRFNCIFIKLQPPVQYRNGLNGITEPFFYYIEYPLVHGVLKLCYFLTVKQTFGCVASESEYEQCRSFGRFLAGIQSAPLPLR
jgi:hypothetical protein